MTEVQRLAKIMVLKDLLKEYELLAKYNGGTDYDRYCALEMAIKALEEEPILDKIRTEILDNAFSVVNPKDTYEYINVIDLDSIDKIFNKYKSEIDPHESEDKG